jgi:hypothetical protein
MVEQPQNQTRIISGTKLLGTKRLASLATDMLILIANALAFVRLRWSNGTNFSSELSAGLLVTTL